MDRMQARSLGHLFLSQPQVEPQAAEVGREYGALLARGTRGRRPLDGFRSAVSMFGGTTAAHMSRLAARGHGLHNSQVGLAEGAGSAFTHCSWISGPATLRFMAGASYVLIVDADEVALFRARRLLVGTGVELATVTTGRGALELLRARPAVMVFAALRLGDGDGFTFLLNLRRQSRQCQCALYSSGPVPRLEHGHDIPVLEVPAPIEAIVEIAAAMCAEAVKLPVAREGLPRR